MTRNVLLGRAGSPGVGLGRLLLVAPEPNGQRNHGRGSTPVASITAACAARMSERSPRALSSGIRAW